MDRHRIEEGGGGASGPWWGVGFRGEGLGFRVAFWYQVPETLSASSFLSLASTFPYTSDKEVRLFPLFVVL